MRKRLIYSLTFLFLLFAVGAGLTMLHIYRVTANLQSVINLHRVEIIRQNLVINLQTVQANLYAAGTSFGVKFDVLVDHVNALDDSVRRCNGCHHSREMTARLKELNDTVGQYKRAISKLTTTTARRERIDGLKAAAVSIGDTLLAGTREMAFIADKSLTLRTVGALRGISNSKIILLVTIVLSFFIALTIAIILARQITKPVFALVDATRMIAAGRLGYKTSYDDTSEFGELARRFNAMSEQLKEEHEGIIRYVGQLSGLYDITLSFYRITETEDAYRTICRDIGELLKVAQCSLLLYDSGSDMFVAHPSAYGLTAEEAGLLRVPRIVGEELFHRAKGLPLRSNAPHEDDWISPLTCPPLREESLLVSWLHGSGMLTGMLRAANKDGGFVDEDAKLLSVLANHMAVAMENAHLYRYLQDQMIELRATHEQLVQSAKLAAIGELASNIAHEINNPLTSIIGFTEILKDEEDVAAIKSRLDIIEKESLRARDIVRQLLQFARKRDLELVEVDVNDVVKDVTPLVEAGAKSSGVTLRADFGELPKTIGDPNQLKQVVINIVTNALSAMTAGGALSIRTSRLGEHIVMDFADTGPGIPKTVLPHIFEPFFTTKKEKGTGLGLSISYRIIQDHGGRIDVESREGEGATFSIRLPVRNSLS
jgi:signal transduction histidine kinase/HAMP domain-containing protein